MGLPSKDFPPLQKTDREIGVCVKKYFVKNNQNRDQLKDLEDKIENLIKSPLPTDQENHDCFK